jgi:hypothetical protein
VFERDNPGPARSPGIDVARWTSPELEREDESIAFQAELDVENAKPIVARMNLSGRDGRSSREWLLATINQPGLWSGCRAADDGFA